MTALLAPSPLTGNFCKRIMCCWNTELQRFTYETGCRSDMGAANKVKSPVLSLCLPNTKILECDRNLLILTEFKLCQYEAKEVEHLMLAEK